MHWANTYIGIPYLRGGRNLDGLDCWGLVVHVQRNRYAREMPALDITLDAKREVVEAFKSHPEHGNWHPVSDPQEGDCIELGQGSFIDHVGVWVDVDGGGVLHAVTGKGVVFSAFNIIRHDWPLFKVWRHNAVH